MTDWDTKKDGPTVLVIDDVAPILRILELELRIHGYNVVSIAISEQVFEVIEQIDPDIVVLEVFLPQMRGMELLRGIRERSDVPVVFLTTSDNDADRDEALSHGASDYILKPFRPDELTYRISSALKARPPASRVLRSGRLRIDFSRREAFRGDLRLSVSSSEWALLFAMARAAGEHVPAETILLQVWGLEGLLNRASLEEWIGRLRNKLGDDPASPSIVTGDLDQGFMLAMEQEAPE
jgi:two-component system KDP operon response regulator KdpE